VEVNTLRQGTGSVFVNIFVSGHCVEFKRELNFDGALDETQFDVSLLKVRNSRVFVGRVVHQQEPARRKNHPLR
jgi:hypothetical protein